MRKSLVLATLLVLCTGMTASAGVPDPSRSGVETIGDAVGCQYRFRHDGGLDTLNVLITLRDAFDDVVGNCSTSVTLVANAGTLAYCNCCPDMVGGVTAVCTARRTAIGRSSTRWTSAAHFVQGRATRTMSDQRIGS